MAFDSYEPDENIRACDKYCIGEAELMDKIRKIYKKISILQKRGDRCGYSNAKVLVRLL